MSWRTVLNSKFYSETEKLKLFAALTRALSPAYLRIGGTTSNFLVYQSNKGEGRKPFGKRTLDITSGDLDRINNIAEDAGWKVRLALSVCRRTTNGSWDPGNAFRIVKYVAERGYKFGWELGNGR